MKFSEQVVPTSGIVATVDFDIKYDSSVENCYSKNDQTFWSPNLDEPILFQEFASDCVKVSEIAFNRKVSSRHLPAQS